MLETTPVLQNNTADSFPTCIYLAGADGTGKTTLATKLVEELRSHGARCKHVWLRFPQLLSIPLLVYARLRGYSYYEVIGDARYGYWNFSRSWVMSRVFPWVMLVDAFLFSIVQVYVPLWLGYTVICERFALDMLVDLAVGLDDASFWQHYPGKLFLMLIPANMKVVVLDLDVTLIRQRRGALLGDRSLARRRELYLKLARDQKIKTLNTIKPVIALADEVLTDFRTK